MRALTTELFRAHTTATAQRVWNALTQTGTPLGHLYGLTVHTTWRLDATLTAELPGGPRLTGRVLHADPPRLLSYTLGDRNDDPAVYVTWQLDPHSEGTIIRLYIDEPAPADRHEIERAWLPVLAALEQHARCDQHPT